MYLNKPSNCLYFSFRNARCRALGIRVRSAGTFYIFMVNLDYTLRFRCKNIGTETRAQNRHILQLLLPAEEWCHVTSEFPPENMCLLKKKADSWNKNQARRLWAHLKPKRNVTQVLRRYFPVGLCNHDREGLPLFFFLIGNGDFKGQSVSYGPCNRLYRSSPFCLKGKEKNSFGNCMYFALKPTIAQH